MNSTIVVMDMKIKTFESNSEQFSRFYDKQLKLIFQNLFSKSKIASNKFDKIISTRFFFQNLIARSELLSELVNRFKFYEFLTIYHKEKVIIKEENKTSSEVSKAIETLFDNDLIYFEICELLYLSCRFYIVSNSQQDKIENYGDIINHLVEISKGASCYFTSEQKTYTYPKLKNHKILDSMIEAEKQKQQEEERRKLAQKLLENERNMMVIEDVDVLPPGDEDEENEMSDDSNPF
jgi:hypothetical protein